MAIKEIDATKTTADIEHLLGDQVRRLRIGSGLDQTQLAAAANVSLGAVKNLEGGKGSSLKTLIMVLRALRADDWLEQLAPAPTVSPMQMLRDQRLQAPRQRVYKKRSRLDV